MGLRHMELWRRHSDAESSTRRRRACSMPTEGGQGLRVSCHSEQRFDAGLEQFMVCLPPIESDTVEYGELPY